MERFTYCLVNTWVNPDNPSRHVYVKFPCHFDEPKVKALTNKLQDIRIKLNDDPKSTEYDIVQKALDSMEIDFNIKGSIISGCNLIVF